MSHGASMSHGVSMSHGASMSHAAFASSHINTTRTAQFSTSSSKSPWNRFNRMWFPEDEFIFVGSTRLSDTRRKYTFRVHPSKTKHEIKDYLQCIYGVKVLKVNTMNYQGKVKRRYKEGGSGGFTNYRTKSFKKAIVTLDLE